MTQKCIAPEEPKLFGQPKYDVEEAARNLEAAQQARAKPKLLAAAIKLLHQRAKATSRAIDWASKF